MKKVTLTEQDINNIARDVVLEMEVQNLFRKIAENAEYRQAINESKRMDEGIGSFIRKLGLTVTIYKCLDIVINKLGIDRSKPFYKFLTSKIVKGILSYKVAKAINNGIEKQADKAYKENPHNATASMPAATGGNNPLASVSGLLGGGQGNNDALGGLGSVIGLGGNMLLGKNNGMAAESKVNEIHLSTTTTGVALGSGTGMLTSVIMKVLLKDVIGVSDNSVLGSVLTSPILMGSLGGMVGGIAGANQGNEGGLLNKAQDGINNFLNGNKPTPKIADNPGMANAPSLSESKIDEAVTKAMNKVLNK